MEINSFLGGQEVKAVNTTDLTVVVELWKKLYHNKGLI